MRSEVQSRVVPGVRDAGTRRATGEPVVLEILAPPFLIELEQRTSGVFETHAVFPDILQMALIEWSAKHGVPAESPWVRTGASYRMAIPVVRSADGLHLELIDGAATVLRLQEVDPPKLDGKFPVLLSRR